MIKHHILSVVMIFTCNSMLRAQPKGLDTFIDSMVKDHRFSGVVLVGKLYSKDPPLSKFITASTAKTFTAVGILRLVEVGKIGIDDPLSHYLPDSVYPHRIADHITIRQLLTHTAGLGDVISSKAFRWAPQDFHRLSDLVALVRTEGPVDSIAKFLYGASDYILLGAVIESVTGQSFTQYMAEHVFHPSGMLNSSFDLAGRPAGLARGYTPRKIGGDTVAGIHSNDVILPHTGVPGAVAYTTATDLLRFARALAENRLLEKATLAELWKGQVTTGREGANRQYGYGFFVGEIGSHALVNHGGTGPGIDVCFDIYPDLGDVVVILSNLDPPAAQDIRDYIRDQMAR